MPISFEWRGSIDNAEIEALHAEGFEHDPVAFDWSAQLGRHSLGWVTARDENGLVGFVNVAWDGGAHAFLVDTVTARRARRHGIGTRLVGIAVENARAAGCEWLHVDFDAELAAFYLERCGFTATQAGLVAL